MITAVLQHAILSRGDSFLAAGALHPLVHRRRSHARMVTPMTAIKTMTTGGWVSNPATPWIAPRRKAAAKSGCIAPSNRAGRAGQVNCPRRPAGSGRAGAVGTRQLVDHYAVAPT